MILHRRQGARPSPRKRNAKWLSEEALQMAVNRRKVKGKGEKERYIHLNAEFQKNSKERLKKKKSLPQQSMQRKRGKQ